MAFTNSDLVSYTRISPHKTANRNHTIDTISIHCAVAQWTAKQGCDYFATTDRACSCNYFVGKDGTIGLCVEEKDRSWCTSSASNDHRAITIEVASDTRSPYTVTAQAYNALIELLADICQRNHIPKLLWKADKNLIGQVDKQNMTVHRWFANKDCPGKYLYERHGEIASAVNAKIDGEAPTNPSDFAEYIWFYFLERINNKYGVAGLMGNLYAESALKPNNLQGSFESSLGYTDETYTEAVDTGSYSENQFINDSAGYGLAQWTYSTRKSGLYEMYRTGGYTSIGDIRLACDYLWHELQTMFPSVLSALENAPNVRTASNKVLHDFESPKDQSAAVEEKRAEYGLYYYNKFANATDSGTGDFTPDNNMGGNSRRGAMSLLLLAIATDYE